MAVASEVELQRIITASNCFAVFDLPFGSNIVEVKRSFRQFALRVHPDKNSAPLATEAFKRLAQALEQATNSASLSDPSDLPSSRKTACWWEQDWDFIEEWMRRQEEEFEKNNAKHRESMKSSQILKRKKQEEAHKRVQAGLAHLKARHGLGPRPPTPPPQNVAEDEDDEEESREEPVFQEVRLKFEVQTPNTGLDENGQPISEHETDSEGE